MKKLICALLTLVLLLSLGACGEKAPATTEPAATTPTEPADTTPTEEQKKPEDLFFLVYEGTKLIPGTAFDPDAMPVEANEMFEVPSCAIEGTDNVYSYDAFELTAYNDGSGEVIYSIYFMDPNIATSEGLYMGDDRITVEQLYGTDYVEQDTELVYTKGNTQLRLILEEDIVVSIEYRMVTE